MIKIITLCQGRDHIKSISKLFVKWYLLVNFYNKMLTIKVLLMFLFTLSDVHRPDKSILVHSKTVEIDRAKWSNIILSIIKNKNVSNQKLLSIFHLNCFKFGIEIMSKACRIADPCCFCFCRRGYPCT